MYFKRDMEDELMKWKNTPSHLVAYVQGARQVGKTTMIEHFVARNYKNVVQVQTAEDRLILENQLDQCSGDHVTAVIAYAQIKGITYEDNKDTVLFIDEIQESKRIYELIRFFNRDLHCDVVVTGSYLWLASNYFHPVGDVNYFTVRSMSFPEFLGVSGLREVYECAELLSLDDEDLQYLWQLWETYTRVGGYPAVVKAWLGGDNYEQVLKAISLGVSDEINVRINDLVDSSKLDAVFQAMLQVATQNKRGDTRLVDTLSKITSNYETGRISTKELYSMLAWIYKAGFVQYVDKRNLMNNEIKSHEKLYFTDLGMLTYFCRKFAVSEDVYKGLVAETFVLNTLVEQGLEPQFGVWDDYELDFVVPLGLNLYGIEVKTNAGIGISITKAKQEGLVTDAVYFKKANYGTSGGVTTIPLPLAWKFTFERRDSSGYTTHSAESLKEIIEKVKIKNLTAFK